MRLSPQQQAVVDFVISGKGNATAEAVAGSGKTSTLIAACRHMAGSVAFCAYNKKIADEIGSKLVAAGVGKNVRAATFHSFGFAAWRRVAPTVKVDEKKSQIICQQLSVPQPYHIFVSKAVSLAKQKALGVIGALTDESLWYDIVDHHDLLDTLEEAPAGDGRTKLEEALHHSYAVMERSIELDREFIDFDDMIFAPLIHNAPFWQNDWVLVDEAQDTNPARRAMAKKMLKAGGRALFVGDRHQAIYGFTGADNDSLDLISREFATKELPLTVTWRCPKAVVALARTWVSHITAAPEAPEGSTEFMSWGDFEKITPAATDAILCRNTKPLVELAFLLIRRGVGCHVEGKDIGKGLLNLVNKWKSVKTVADLRLKLNEYVELETQRLNAKGQEMKAEALNDRVDTLFVIMDTIHDDCDKSVIAGAIFKLFGDTEPGKVSNTVTLSTVHKSKGREWDRVYLLGRAKFMPSRYARQQWQQEQEINLMYVAVTRAKQTLVDVAAPPEKPRD